MGLLIGERDQSGAPVFRRRVEFGFAGPATLDREREGSGTGRVHLGPAETHVGVLGIPELLLKLILRHIGRRDGLVLANEVDLAHDDPVPTLRSRTNASTRSRSNLRRR